MAIETPRPPTAMGIAEAVRRGDLSAQAVVEQSLERAAEVEPTVHAFVEIHADEALERARSIDERVKQGRDPGPLAGVPVGLKDNLSREGWPLTCGSRILEGYEALFSATVVERLEAAGAVILGRTNLDEFAMGSSTETSVHGPTTNPWDSTRVPGGSSGGSAAAVASGVVPLALGSDTGGSVRQPAALCGVVGLKPTRGRVSRSGLVAFAPSLDAVGPLAGNVADAARALTVIAGADGRDATTDSRPVPGLEDRLDAGFDGLRVGVVDEMEGQLEELRDLDDFETAGVEAVRRDFAEAVGRVGSAGAEVVPVSVPHVPAALAAYAVVANAEASTQLARFDGLRYGRRIPAGTVDETLRASRTRGFGAEVKRRILLGTFALSVGYADAYYQRARNVRRELRRQLEAVLETVDVLLTPTVPEPAFPLGERMERPLAMARSDVFTTPASLAGLPAVAVPSGLSDDDLPLSVQWIGRPFDEATLLRAARAFEGTTGGLA